MNTGLPLTVSSAGTPAEMDFTVLESIKSVREMSDEWASLTHSALDPDPFSSPDWLLAWWESFCDSEWKMQVGVLRLNGELVGVVPLYVSKEQFWGRGVRVLKSWVNSYSNRVTYVVSAEIAQEVIRELVACIYTKLTAEWDIAILGPMMLDSKTTKILSQELSTWRTGCAIMEGHASPHRVLPNSSEQLEESLGPSFKKSLHRKINKASRADVRIEFSSDPRRLADAMDISIDTWQHAAGSGIGSNRDVKTFYERIAARFARIGQLQLAFLSVDGGPVAFELNVTFARTVYNLKVGYRKKYRHLSPGIVLRHYVLCHAIEQEFEEFDFLGVSEGYKLHWASSTRAHGRVVFTRRRGYWWILYLLRYATKPYVKKTFPWIVKIKRWLQQRLETSKNRQSQSG